MWEHRRAIKNGQYRETDNIRYTRKTKQKYNAICVGPSCTQTNTNNVNKRRALLQTTGGKYEPNIVFYAEIVRYYQLRRNILEVSIQV